MKKIDMYTVLFASLAVISLVLLPGCSKEVGAGGAATTSALPQVRVAEIGTPSEVLPIRTSGRLASKAEIKLSFKIGGLVDRLFVDEGARVRKGTRLARLNLAEIDAQVLQATSGLEKATRDLKRVEGLFKDSVATLEQLQDSRTAVEIAEAGLQIASFNRTHAEILAPSAGRILKRTAEAGEMIAPGQPVYLFGANREGWIVRVGLADRDIVKLAVGDSASLAFDPFPDVTFRGWVTEVADAADPLSGTFEVEIAVEDTENRLKSGFIARVDLYPTKQDPFVVIPIEALVEGNREEGVVYLYDQEAGEAKKVVFRIAQILDDEVAVASGLESESIVITEGAGLLKGNGPVQVVSGL